jgi:1,5-anhydro-D-fructose reductase (1,5-anhydro-D-mannitol-forming)
MDKNSTLGWGLIGASTIAREQMIPAIRAQDNSQVVAVMSSSPERGRDYADDLEIPRSHSTVEALLADPGVDAVYISTTNELHRDQTIKAAAAGKHVLCEKPLALTLEDARAMVDACSRAGVVMGTNHHLRNSMALRVVRDAIKEGLIGQPLAARVTQAIYLRPHTQTWRINNPSAGGGVVMDIGVHCADTLRFLLDDEPCAVVAMARSTGLASQGLEDLAMAVVEFEGGVIASLHMGHNTRHAETGVEIHGTLGSVLARDALTQKPLGGVILRTADGERELPYRYESIYEGAARTFSDAIRNGVDPVASGEDGLRSLAVALAIRLAMESGRRVAIPGD